MDDFLETVARRKHQGAYTVIYFLTWVLIVVFGFYALINFSSIIGSKPDGSGIQFNFQALIAAVIAGGIAFLLWRRSDYCRVEYDYTFTNGVLDVGQVLNNKRRRYLTQLDMKDVVRCGPTQGPTFEKTLRENGVKRHNWFLNRDANLYYFYFVKNNVKHLAVLELTDEMIAMIRSKSYLPRGAWAADDGKSGYGVS